MYAPPALQWNCKDNNRCGSHDDFQLRPCETIAFDKPFKLWLPGLHLVSQNYLIQIFRNASGDRG